MIKISGPWKLGYAFDLHTTNSEHIGNDQYGRPLFNTTRSPIGQCLYNLKYNQSFSETEKTINILSADTNFVSFIKGIDVILPVPPTNRYRRLQPVIIIAQELARLFGKELRQDVFTSSNFEEIKNIDAKEKYERIKKALNMEGQLEKTKSILLFDDVFDSGATLTAMTNTLLEKEFSNINIFALTKTRISN